MRPRVFENPKGGQKSSLAMGVVGSLALDDGRAIEQGLHVISQPTSLVSRGTALKERAPLQAVVEISVKVSALQLPGHAAIVRVARTGHSSR